METVLALLVGVFFMSAIYLILSRRTVRILIGVVILGNAVNLLIFTAGRLTVAVPPVIPTDLPTVAGTVANPLPQALILTAIVISFSLFAFLLILSYRAFQELGTDDVDEMRDAEPAERRLPPMEY
ncbi:Na+/H+ antiporter subunit C [Amorphus orientalis]|uniref:Multicomponent Na+:H+ antiporter subunit C n=1 Tax=Amorphus orientalis TaxID=649198 RepID=A0AAE4ATL8_9HYPH|nr:Na+/H+ antiporter subunit C [Amorphus orientalis]MDQ0315104.1 multicomponent Na+:H+ antiporter subunit C [Amorphus orientalis]